MSYLRNLTQSLSMIKVTDVIDILVIAVIIYYLIVLVRETRAVQLIKGFAAILILAQLSNLFNLYTVNWLLSNLLTAGFILVIVVFQPELRRAFERLGRSQGWISNLVGAHPEDEKKRAGDEEIIRAAMSLSRQKIGALIVMEGRTGLSDIAESGTAVDALISAELLINIFIPNTPLHDGAVLVRNDRVMTAGAFLPITQNRNLDRELGTRHRAALGISERSDALVVVVSEETGSISICQDGEIMRHLDEESLRAALYRFGDTDVARGRFSSFSGWFSSDGRKMKASDVQDTSADRAEKGQQIGEKEATHAHTEE